MPTVNIADDISIFYEDSGPVAGDTYTTLITVHGMGFNGGVFKKLFPLAPTHNFRIISLYRRDYHPTTPFKDSELDLLTNGGNESKKRFLLQEGLNLASFLEKVVVELGIPRVSYDQNERGSGGVALIGWSLGSIWMNALLSNLDSVPEGTLAVLEEYIHTVIVHEPSTSGAASSSPPEYDISLWFEPDDSKRFHLFKDWVAAYYHHPDLQSHDQNQLEYNLKTPMEKNATFHDTTMSELESLSGVKPFAGSDKLLVYLDQEVTKESVRRALFDAELASKFLPKVRVRYFYAGETPGILVWTCWQIEKGIQNPSEVYGGEKARDVRVLSSKLGNHFIFWDAPEEALREYRRCLDC